MVDSPKYQFIAAISGILIILSFSHLVFRVYNTKSTEHLTFTWIFLLLSAQTLLMIYGLLNNAYGVYLPPMVIISGLLYILYVKISNSTDKNVETELKEKNII